MIVWTIKDELMIQSSSAPLTMVLKKIPGVDSEKEIVSKKMFPYKNCKDIIFNIEYLGEIYTFTIPKGFRWNGTNCLGLQYFPKLLDASMVHDFLCNHHKAIGNDRQLSSIIFRELGITSGMNRTFMYLAYYAVDIYQKYFGRDLYGEKWN